MLLETWIYGDKTPFVIDSLTIDDTEESASVIDGYDEIAFVVKAYANQDRSDAPMYSRKNGGNDRITVDTDNNDIIIPRTEDLYANFENNRLYEAWFAYRVESTDSFIELYLGQIKIVAGGLVDIPKGGSDIEYVRGATRCSF